MRIVPIPFFQNKTGWFVVTSELLLLFRNEGFTHRLEAEVHTVTLRMDYISSYF